MKGEKITLRCGEETLQADLSVVKKSEVLKDMIEDTGGEGEIKIPNIDIKVLKKVIEYCEQYKDKESSSINQPLTSKNLIENGASEWDSEFIDIEQVDFLIDLIVAANFLDIKGLTDLGSAKMATLIKGKSVQEIRDLFGIENDFTPEEEQQLIEENKWAEETFQFNKIIDKLKQLINTHKRYDIYMLNSIYFSFHYFLIAPQLHFRFKIQLNQLFQQNQLIMNKLTFMLIAQLSIQQNNYDYLFSNNQSSTPQTSIRSVSTSQSNTQPNINRNRSSVQNSPQSSFASKYDYLYDQQRITTPRIQNTSSSVSNQSDDQNYDYLFGDKQEDSKIVEKQPEKQDNNNINQILSSLSQGQSNGNGQNQLNSLFSIINGLSGQNISNSNQIASLFSGLLNNNQIQNTNSNQQNNQQGDISQLLQQLQGGGQQTQQNNQQQQSNTQNNDISQLLKQFSNQQNQQGSNSPQNNDISQLLSQLNNQQTQQSTTNTQNNDIQKLLSQFGQQNSANNSQNNDIQVLLKQFSNQQNNTSNQQNNNIASQLGNQQTQTQNNDIQSLLNSFSQQSNTQQNSNIQQLLNNSTQQQNTNNLNLQQLLSNNTQNTTQQTQTQKQPEVNIQQIQQLLSSGQIDIIQAQKLLNSQNSSNTSQCNCPQTISKVCGSNGKTFNNECLARCNNAQVILNRECPDLSQILPSQSRPTIGDSSNCSNCSQKVEPVCGVNGQTFRNICLLSCQKIAKQKDGIC